MDSSLQLALTLPPDETIHHCHDSREAFSLTRPGEEFKEYTVVAPSGFIRRHPNGSLVGDNHSDNMADANKLIIDQRKEFLVYEFLDQKKNALKKVTLIVVNNVLRVPLITLNAFGMYSGFLDLETPQGQDVF